MKYFLDANAISYIFIASSAIEAGATLVTSNAKHMQRIEGLVVEAWV